MKLVEYRDDFYHFTKEISYLTRNLGLAGVAIVWLFKVDVNETHQYKLSNDFYWSLFFFICTLALDFLHYAIQAATWAIFYYVNKARGVNDDQDVIRQNYLVVLPWVLFALKVISVVIAFWLLFNALFKNHLVIQ